jgi:quercetin dioxygenase-like cupin family protein
MNPTKEEAVADSTLHRWDDIVPEQMNALTARQYVVGTNTMLARLVLKKGALVPLHEHMHEQISHVVEGALKFLLVKFCAFLRLFPMESPRWRIR